MYSSTNGDISHRVQYSYSVMTGSAASCAENILYLQNFYFSINMISLYF